MNIVANVSSTQHLDLTLKKAAGLWSQIDVHFGKEGEQRGWIFHFIFVNENRWKPYLTHVTCKMKFLSPPHPSHLSITHLSWTLKGTLSPKPWVKKKKKTKEKRKLWRYPSFLGGIVSLRSKRVKVATKDTSVILVKSHNFRLLSRDGNTALFFLCFFFGGLWSSQKVFQTSTTWPWDFQSTAEPHRFSASASSCRTA